MRENEPVLLVLSVCDGKIILEKGEILYEKCQKAFDPLTRTDFLCLLFRNEKRAFLPSCRRPLPAAVTTAHERLTLAA
jgi:hypothetical protein